MTTTPVVSIVDELLAELDAIHQDASFVSMEPDSQEYLGSLSERAATELRRLREEVQALRVDSSRLEWLDRQGHAYGFEDMHEGNRWLIDGPFTNLRTAIDTAMQSNTDAMP